ncbi:MAG TPA: hypothetical protein VFQ53_35785 [Kofleriaceae bacterium]|nr:hypothetical protein [Kofleriaceae bacterium]
MIKCSLTPACSDATPDRGPRTIEVLGLAVDVPGPVSVGGAIGGDGARIVGASVGAFSIERAQPRTLDEAKADSAMLTPTNVQTTPLPDGWALTFESAGGTATSYFVEVRRTIAGTSVRCRSIGSDRGQAESVLAACKSLRAKR